jgi:NAD(P)-dependent dehydrogenase (short-subunit alcohol dehydrogenase family)
MGERLKDKGAVVVGGGGGIGAEIALALAAEGAKVIVNDPGGSRDGAGSDTSHADKTVARIKEKGGHAVANYASAVDFNAAREIVDSCLVNFGRLDILVNAAGINREKMLWNMTDQDWDMVLKVHLYTNFNTIRWAAGIMREQRRGRIILMTSSAWLGNIGQINYAAAKGAIVSFTRSAARELGGYGITCNCLAPGAATRMTMTEEVKAGFRRRVETGVMTKEAYEAFLNQPGPEWVPPIVTYLCTDEAWNVNGKVFSAMGDKIGIYSEPVETIQIFNNGNIWTLDQLLDLVPKTLLAGYINPRPPEKPKEKKTG